jgi:von Willebrand factor type A domain
VLDESASINATDAGHVRAAANGFVSALSGTGASVAIIAFAQRARTGVPYTEVTPTTIGSTFSPFINGTSSPSFLYPPASLGTRSGTNWQGAFNQVYTLGELPNLVVFVTDGDPNGTNSTTSFTTSLDGGVDVMSPAVTVANAIKVAGTRDGGAWP